MKRLAIMIIIGCFSSVFLTAFLWLSFFAIWLTTSSGSFNEFMNTAYGTVLNDGAILAILILSLYVAVAAALNLVIWANNRVAWLNSSEIEELVPRGYFGRWCLFVHPTDQNKPNSIT